jgi:hypothetical protein
MAEPSSSTSAAHPVSAEYVESLLEQFLLPDASIRTVAEVIAIDLNCVCFARNYYDYYARARALGGILEDGLYSLTIRANPIIIGIPTPCDVNVPYLPSLKTVKTLRFASRQNCAELDFTFFSDFL